MARIESSREDLIREATALVERIEIVPPASDLGCGHVIAGFRCDGAFSVFFGEDPVYQFNGAGELRRAYCDGRLLKAVRGRLVALKRLRTPEEVQLVSQELSNDEEAALLVRMADSLRQLAALLESKGFEITGRVPPNADVLGRIRNWLATHDRWPVAARPNVGR